MTKACNKKVFSYYTCIQLFFCFDNCHCLFCLRDCRLQDTVEVLQTRCDELQLQVTEMKRKKWEEKFASQSTLHNGAPAQTTAGQNGGAANAGGMTRSITLGDGLKTPIKRNSKDESDSEDEGSSPETGILKEKIKVEAQTWTMALNEKSIVKRWHIS